MALEVEHSYHTFSRNVVLRDLGLELYAGIDVRPFGGVQFDVYLMSEGGSSPHLDLGLEGFRGVIEVIKHDTYPDDDDYILSIDLIVSSEVIFNHVDDPEHFNATSDANWSNLALDVVEWLLRSKGQVVTSMGGSPVVRRSRYGREPLL